MYNEAESAAGSLRVRQLMGNGQKPGEQGEGMRG